MASTLFVALQCCECSTMQVKQKKKSSNKWVCVICNQKQSVTKVFAQGYKAKELRFFVQSFNMSRKDSDEEAQAIAETYLEADVQGEIDEEVSDVRGKKRSDWSEYLNSDSHNNDDRRLTEEEEDDVKIVTKMPKDMFKKRPKLNKYSNGGGSSSVTGGGKNDGNELFKPSSSGHSIKEPEFHTDGVMMMKKVTEHGNIMSERVTTKPASKWDAYLIDDEGEQQAPSRVDGSIALKDDDDDDDDGGECDRAILETSSGYQIVDDEVHPDFM